MLLTTHEGGTSTLRRHVEKCLNKHQTATNETNILFDQNVSKTKVVKMIIMHERPLRFVEYTGFRERMEYYVDDPYQQQQSENIINIVEDNDDDTLCMNDDAGFSYEGNGKDYISFNNESDYGEDYISSNNESDDTWGIASKVVYVNPIKAIVRWSVPSHGFYKLNTYAALTNDGLAVGLDLVIRDSEGDVMATKAVSVGAKLLSLEAKALAILQRIEMALESDITPFVVEFDSAMVVNLVRSRSVVLFRVDLYIEDIISKFDNLSFVDIIFIPRTANTVVHGLTKFAL
ncbi:hypothetical protein JRO89_XS02G0068000 [Xanthoceras sorbifolium]|uniref:RNase H type-1 domain-containing protein n=1 Tax=Xanthoceras sorbifolium TaxID=99658 RepID=A0ABQ8IEX9_9ROSI|nr:hypothetical protein JRO89_XS02G0068000 [Xanthoceras sorbifolium]